MYRPNLIPRMEWRDIDGNIMKGKHYKWDAKQFHKKKDSNRSDKLIEGLILMEEKGE